MYGENAVGRVILLNPKLRRFKVVVEGYPLNLPLDAVEVHLHVLSAKTLRSGRDNISTRQVFLVYKGPPPPKLNLGCWDTYTLRPYQSEPVRCYKCQRYSHLQVRCEHSIRCGVCSLPHPMEECIGRHKAKEVTTVKCPNCDKKHHANAASAALAETADQGQEETMRHSTCRTRRASWGRRSGYPATWEYEATRLLTRLPKGLPEVLE